MKAKRSAKSIWIAVVLIVAGILLLISGTYLVRYVAMAPKSAKTMFEKAKIEQVMDMQGEANMKFRMDDSLEVPLKLTFDGTYDWKKAGLHLDSLFSMELFQNKSEQKMSFYGENLGSDDAKMYGNFGDGWSPAKTDDVSPSDVQKDVMSLFTLLHQDESIVNESAFTADGNADNKYTVKQEFVKLAKNKAFQSWLSEKLKAYNVPETYNQTVLDSMTSGTVSYVFDKYYHLRQIQISDVFVSQEADLSLLMGEGSENTNITFSFDFIMDVMDAGDSSAVNIPDEVRNSTPAPEITPVPEDTPDVPSE